MGEIVNPDGTPWVPAFKGQRPPFQKGNEWAAKPGSELALKHGAFSPRRVDPIAHQFLDEIANDPALDYLKQPRFQAGLWLWASAQAKVQCISEWVDAMPIDKAANSARGQTSPLELLGKWSTRAATYASRLGLDPLSAARLGKDIAQGRQADAAGELTRLRAQHEAAQHEQDPDA